MGTSEKKNGYLGKSVMGVLLIKFLGGTSEKCLLVGYFQKSTWELLQKIISWGASEKILGILLQNAFLGVSSEKKSFLEDTFKIIGLLRKFHEGTLE